MVVAAKHRYHPASASQVFTSISAVNKGNGVHYCLKCCQMYPVSLTLIPPTSSPCFCLPSPGREDLPVMLAPLSSASHPLCRASICLVCFSCRLSSRIKQDFPCIFLALISEITAWSLALVRGPPPATVLVTLALIILISVLPFLPRLCLSTLSCRLLSVFRARPWATACASASACACGRSSS